jgi:hypothetical protein
MADKQTLVPPADRPPLPKPAPDKRLSELQVRDLEALLEHATLHKPAKFEILEHKHPKLEKYEKLESKWEHLKAELGKWEHGEFVVQDLPGPGPVEARGIDQLITVVTQLQSTVADLSQQVETLKRK